MTTFTAEVLRTGGNTMGFVVPEDVLGALGKGRRPPVVVTINGYTYRRRSA